MRLTSEVSPKKPDQVALQNFGSLCLQCTKRTRAKYLLNFLVGELDGGLTIIIVVVITNNPVYDGFKISNSRCKKLMKFS
jgi:hypothetical protein